MSTTLVDFRTVLKKLALEQSLRTLDQAGSLLKKELELLVDQGVLGLGPDHTLTGASLELRVQRLFMSVGFPIKTGRPGQEDFVVEAPPGATTKDPCALEVKSHRNPTAQRDDLRQLDDWVFDLSGEEAARKHGLGGGIDILAIATSGLVSQYHRHPTPHKGVLIFSGPVGTPFSQRGSPCVQPNDIDFVQKRNFCVISLHKLIQNISDIQSRSLAVEDFWEKLQSTAGEF